jgi:energy-coupling factor transport system substrate-specific component
MSWPLGSFTLLAIALAGGFAWYERTRPDARIVALVGTLAAFAALGRIAFVALPNVKPTTDIVLVAGYALGGAPGFVVGAVAGLVSNFFFGQGPWTPWQMAAWGATGLLGAGLAVLTRGRLPRWPLALSCAAVGFAFAAFQDVGDWVTYSDHSASQLGVYVGKGVGFDLVHAGGCLAFALIFGPALIRSVSRFATRLQVTWRPPPAGTVVPAIAAAALLGGALTVAVPTTARAATPRSYLLSAQNPDGGYGPVPRQPSSQMYSAWAALGLAAQGDNPLSIRAGGPSLLGYVSAGAGPSSDTGVLERTILVIRAAGSDAAGLAAALAPRFAHNGSVGGQVNLTAFGVLALRAAGTPAPAAAFGWLLRQQNSDGGFSFAAAGDQSDVDDTAAALQALSGAGGPAAQARGRAVGFIAAQQNRDGGLPAQSGGDSNAQSTAWAIQGLLAAGADPGALHRRGAPSPLQYLGSLIAPDGHVRYSRSSDQTPIWVTGEAAMALAGKPLPIPPLPPPATARSSGAAAPSRPGRGRVVAHRATTVASPPRGSRSGPGPRRAQRRPAGLRSGPTPVLGQLASDAGLATAILLAPVGVG